MIVIQQQQQHYTQPTYTSTVGQCMIVIPLPSVSTGRTARVYDSYTSTVGQYGDGTYKVCTSIIEPRGCYNYQRQQELSLREHCAALACRFVASQSRFVAGSLEERPAKGCSRSCHRCELNTMVARLAGRNYSARRGAHMCTLRLSGFTRACVHCCRPSLAGGRPQY